MITTMEPLQFLASFANQQLCARAPGLSKGAVFNAHVHTKAQNLK